MILRHAVPFAFSHCDAPLQMREENLQFIHDFAAKDCDTVK